MQFCKLNNIRIMLITLQYPWHTTSSNKASW